MNTRSGEGFPNSAVRGLRSAAVPLATCLISLGALTAWTAAGNAGQPRGLEISGGRIFTPLREGPTAAFFTFRNTGTVDERITGIKTMYGDSSHAMLSRNIRTGANARTMTRIEDATVPAKSTLKMSPYGLNVMVTPAPKLKPGDRVRFTFYFTDRAPITTKAVAVRPQELP